MLGLVVQVAQVVVELRAQPAGEGHLIALGQQVHVRDALRKSADGGAPVADHHAAGPVAIDQVGKQAVARFFVALGDAGKPMRECVALFGEEWRQCFDVARSQAFTGQQAFGQRRQRDVLALFFDKIRKAGVTRRIEQAQAREMAAQPELLRRRRQQQQRGRLRGKRFNQLVGRAAGFLAPGQVMRFIHQQQVPVGVQRLLRAALVAGQPVHRGDHQLLVIERIASAAVAARRIHLQ